MCFIIKDLQGNTFNINVAPTDTIAAVRLAIMDHLKCSNDFRMYAKQLGHVKDNVVCDSLPYWRINMHPPVKQRSGMQQMALRFKAGKMVAPRKYTVQALQSINNVSQHC